MKCRQCGGKMRRVHRTFFERFSYMAIYNCQKCEREEFAPRRFRYHLGPACRCPICGTYRVVRLKQPDKIDRKQGGFLNLLERMAGGGRLFHCRWCRLQYYDRRPLASESTAKRAGAGGVPEVEAPEVEGQEVQAPEAQGPEVQGLEVEHTNDPAK